MVSPRPSKYPNGTCFRRFQFVFAIDIGSYHRLWIYLMWYNFWFGAPIEYSVRKVSRYVVSARSAAIPENRAPGIRGLYIWLGCISARSDRVGDLLWWLETRLEPFPGNWSTLPRSGIFVYRGRGFLDMPVIRFCCLSLGVHLQIVLGTNRV